MAKTSNTSTSSVPDKGISQANIEEIVAALKVLDTSGGDGKPSLSEMRLSELVVALYHMGINIVSPHEIMQREQAAQVIEKAADDALNREMEIQAQRAQTRRFVIEKSFKTSEARTASIDAAVLASVPSDVESVDTASVTSIDDSDLGILDVGDLNINSTAPVATGSTLADNTSPGVDATPAGDDTVSGENGLGDDSVLKGFVCVACKSYNLLTSSKGSWYAVTKGRRVGVFKDWTVVQPLVTGVSHACFKCYSTQAAATKAFQEAVALGHVMY